MKISISRDANSNTIKKAYRELALRWHPDKNPDSREKSETMFKKIAEAYQVLGDPNKRFEYDNRCRYPPEHAQGEGYHFFADPIGMTLSAALGIFME